MTESEDDKIMYEDEDIEITMTYKIAEILKKNDLDARRAEPILWKLLSNLYRLMKKRDRISTHDVANLIEIHKREVLRESWFDADERLEGFL
jgi:hypothetical protein